MMLSFPFRLLWAATVLSAADAFPAPDPTPADVDARAATSVSRYGTATVHLATTLGPAAHIANGVHNGIPPNGFSAYVAGAPPSSAAVQTQIPDSFISDIKLPNARGGQGNLPDPSRGWTYGLAEYQNRFRAFHSNYLTVRKFGGNYTLMISNLWGQSNSSAVFPGDKGDWSRWDAFVTRISNDLIANKITTGLDVELWNEPDIQWHNFTQFLQYTGRAHHQFKSKLPGNVRIVGPGYSYPPDSSTKWTQFLDFVAANGSVPDTYTYHHLSVNTDPAVNYPIFKTALASRQLPTRPIYCNEFGAPTEQAPSYDVWFISRFERLNIWGLRANWESTATTTSDYLADTLAKSGTVYTPNGSWQVKAYYANMTGGRVQTIASADGGFDVFAVVSGTGPGSTKVITGSHGTTHPYLIKVDGLAKRGYPSSGSVNVKALEFQWTGLHTTASAPKSLGHVTALISNDTITIGTTASSNGVAYAFEF